MKRNAFSPISRRGFLRTSTTAALTAPVFLPRLWAADGARRSPNDRVTVGMIGLGRLGRGTLLRSFTALNDVQVVAVCDVDTTRREEAKQAAEKAYAKQAAAGTYKGCAAYRDFRELLARRDIDAVVVATPDHWHAYVAIAAMAAGKDVYCEKPMCQSIHEGEAMIASVRKHQRILQTGAMQRSMREFRIACELIRNGVIGQVKTIEAGVGPHGPAVPCNLAEEPMEPGLDWDMWLGPAPVRPYNSILSPRGVHQHFPRWRDYREYGGGSVSDWGAHHFDIAQWALDMDRSGPVEITPPADWQTAKTGVRYRYANGVEVAHVDGNKLVFTGTGGKIDVNRGVFTLEVEGKTVVSVQRRDDKNKTFEPGLDQVEREFLTNAKVSLYRSDDQRGDFISAVRSRKEPISPVETGARSATVCHLVNLAYYHGQVLRWDPAKREFTRGTGDPKWLRVPYRNPWVIT